MSFPTKLIGNSFSGGNKWYGGVLASDGCIYCAPSFVGPQQRILKIDPNKETTELVGPAFSFDAVIAAGVAPTDGYVYFAPASNDKVLKFNIRTNKTEFIGESYPGRNKWCDGAMGNDGCVYFAPIRHDRILKLDPLNDSTSLVGDAVVDGGESDSYKYAGAVATKDGASIYFTPNPFGSGQQYLKYDIGTECSTLISVSHLPGRWLGVASGVDGCLYGVPQDGNKILKIDPATTGNPTLVGDDLSLQEGWSWHGAVAANDGCIYGIPSNAEKVLRYNIDTGKTTLVGKNYSGDAKWSGGYLDKKGNIFAIPYEHPRVLQIIPSMFNKNSVSTTNYQSGGIDDSPNNQVDRLGFEVYAQALVSHICSVENADEAISIGFFSPWGSGKSFMWNLTKAEFKRVDDDTAQKNSEREEKLDDTAQNKDAKNDRTGCFNRLLRLRRNLVIWSSDRFPLLNRLIDITLFIGHTDLDSKLMESRWKDKYQSTKTKMQLWGKMVASYPRLAVFAISWLFTWFMKIVRFCLSALFFCHFKGNWKMPETSPETPLKRIYIEFDAWTYRGTEDVWPSMLDQLWVAVEKEFGADTIKWHRAGMEGAKKYVGTKKPKEAQEKTRKQLQIKYNARIAMVAWMLVFFTYVSVGQLVPLLGVSGPSQVGASNPDVWLIMVSITTLLASIAALFAHVSTMNKALKNGMEYINSNDNRFARHKFKEEIGMMGIVHDEVRYLFDFLKTHKARIVLFVDDLDRCEQEVTMQVLWAISLLFGGTGDTSNPITSFLAVDTKVIVDYIEADFKGKVNGFQFLEKIINLPFTIPAMNDEVKKDFCKRAVNNSEFKMSQVYRKALNHKYKTIEQGENIVRHLTDYALMQKNDSKMMSDLILVAKKVNARVLNDLPTIDIKLLDKSVLTESTSKQEKFLMELHKIFDILEKKSRKGNPTPTPNPNPNPSEIPPNSAGSNTPANNDDNNGDTANNSSTDPDIPVIEDGNSDTTNNSPPNTSVQRQFYERKSMVSEDEEQFIEKYARFLDAVPRKIKRILNVYNLSRNIVRKHDDTESWMSLEKLFVYTALQELCPYRTSWLVYISKLVLIEEETNRKIASTVKYESKSLYSLLEDVKKEGNLDRIQDLDLRTVYTRIVCGVLHCLPTAKQHIKADSGLMYYDTLLNGLTVKDLFPGCLQQYTFNLPQHMMTEIKLHRNFCIIYKRIIDDELDKRHFWVAAFREVHDWTIPLLISADHTTILRGKDEGNANERTTLFESR